MSYNNAAEVNVKCEKAITSLLDLNDFALLHVFSYLNLIDSIHFAETSKRLKAVGGLHFTKYKRFHLVKYERSKQSKRLLAETILSHIGRHVEALSINSMPSTVAKAVMDKCVNVKTLKIYDCDDTSELKNWMKQLKLESLTIDRCSHFNEMSVGLAALKELHFIGCNVGLCAVQLKNILERTTELESLTVDLIPYRNFNYDIFTKLPKLKSLDITIIDGDLVNLAEFLKMDALTRFKIFLPLTFNDVGLRRLDAFLEILADRGKLNELQLKSGSVDENTLRILKSFHLTSLKFCILYYVDFMLDKRWIIHQLVDAQPNLKHLDFMDTFLRIEHVRFVVKNLVKLETFTFRMQSNDLGQLNDSKLNKIVKTTTSRPKLTLYINWKTTDGVEIEFWLEQRKELGHDNSYFLTDRVVERHSVRFKFDWCGRELRE